MISYVGFPFATPPGPIILVSLYFLPVFGSVYLKNVLMYSSEYGRKMLLKV